MVTQTYRAQNSGSALSETTVVRAERTGTIETPLVGPFTTLSALSIDQVIPSGSQITVQLVGLSAAKTLDTLLTVQNQSIISLSSINTKLSERKTTLPSDRSAGASHVETDGSSTITVRDELENDSAVIHGIGGLIQIHYHRQESGDGRGTDPVLRKGLQCE